MSLAQAPEFYGVESEPPTVGMEHNSATPNIERDRSGWPLIYAALGFAAGPWGVVTAAPLAGLAEHAGRIIAQLDLTSATMSIAPLVRAVLVAQPVDLQSLNLDLRSLNPQSEKRASADPGTPSVYVLLKAVSDLSLWLAMTQERLARYIGISPSTIMAWRRQPTIHPRHGRVQSLLRLWAAASEARQELGEEALLRLVWTGTEGVADGSPRLSADELAEELLREAETVSAAGFVLDDDYDPLAASSAVDVQEIEKNELRLSAELRRFHEDAGGPNEE